MYGYEIRNRLAAEGESVQLSYLYKALKEMSDEGLLHSRLKRGEHGPQTRLYCLTPKGKKELGAILEEATELIHDFYEEYVANLPPEFFSEKFHRMTIEVCSGRANVALAISQPLTHLHREVLEGICGRSGAKSTYLIKPAHVERLAPTYRLRLGEVGASSAIEIARRVGLPEDVCLRAREILGSGASVVSQAVERLEQERAASARRSAELQASREELERERGIGRASCRG